MNEEQRRAEAARVGEDARKALQQAAAGQPVQRSSSGAPPGSSPPIDRDAVLLRNEIQALHKEVEGLHATVREFRDFMRRAILYPAVVGVLLWVVSAILATQL